MKVIVVGTGTIGTAVGETLKEHGHEVVSLGRKSGDYQADISNMESLKNSLPVSADSTLLRMPPATSFLGRSKP